MMVKGRKRFFFPYLSIFFGLILIAAEFFLSLYGKSLCPTKGCEVAGLMIIIPKNYLLLLAFFYLCLLFILTFLYRLTKGSFFKDLLFFLGGSGIFAEAIFLLRLFWDLGLLCYFCLAIAFFTLLTVFTLFSFLLREPLTSTSILALFLGSMIGLIITFLITGTGIALRAKRDLNRGYLIYSEECSQCQTFLKDPNFAHLEKVHVKEVYPLLKILNISTLPIMVEKKGDTIIITTPQAPTSACDSQAQGGLCVIP